MPNLVILAAQTGVTSAVQTAFETAIDGVKTDALALINAAIPVALSIGAAVLVIRIGWNFFRSMAK